MPMTVKQLRERLEASDYRNRMKRRYRASQGLMRAAPEVWAAFHYVQCGDELEDCGQERCDRCLARGVNRDDEP